MSEKEKFVNVVQGDFAISAQPAVVLTTVLGSCVAVCLMDRTRGIGGMNHFLLPSGGSEGGSSMRYGTHAMELLINGLLKQGAERSRLEAKVFGGARMNDNLRDIGASNVAFAKDFLLAESIPILSESLLGSLARRIRFWPANGRVRQLLVEGTRDLQPERPPVVPHAPDTSDIVLF